MMQPETKISSVLAPRLEKRTSAKVDSMLSTITTANNIEYIPMVTLTTDIYKALTKIILPHIRNKVLLFFLKEANLAVRQEGQMKGSAMLKDDVLKLLSRENGYSSGEAISRTLGVTRAAVNAAVKSLREDGYEIESSTNKGYLLINCPDILSKGSIAAFLPDDKSPLVHVFDSVDSTNNVLKDLSSKGAPSGTVVIADHQTGGKGRRGRSFMSPSGVGIYLSYLLKPEAGFDKISDLTSWTAVAVADAIKNAYGLDSQIKWVNDLLMNRKKICGILTEVSVEGESGFIDTCIIGIGVNVNETLSDFPAEISEIATSISLENDGKKFFRSKLAAEIIRSMDKLSSNWPDGSSYYLERYRDLNITVGSKITAYSQMLENGKGRMGTALAINDDFSLKVEFADGSVSSLRSGEVSVRGLYGYT